MPTNLDTVVSTLRQQTPHDHIGLWEIIKNIKRFVRPEKSKLKVVTLDCVRLMLSAGFVAGVSRGRTFERWPDQSVEKVIERIDAEWSALGREPNIGDIAWFEHSRSV